MNQNVLIFFVEIQISLLKQRNSINISSRTQNTRQTDRWIIGSEWNEKKKRKKSQTEAKWLNFFIESSNPREISLRFCFFDGYFEMQRWWSSSKHINYKLFLDHHHHHFWMMMMMIGDHWWMGQTRKKKITIMTTIHQQQQQQQQNKIWWEKKREKSSTIFEQKTKTKNLTEHNTDSKHTPYIHIKRR